MQSDLCPNVRRPHFAVVRSCPPPHICLSCGHQSPDIYPPGHPRHLTTVRYSEPQTSPRPVMCPACGLLPLDFRCLDISPGHLHTARTSPPGHILVLFERHLPPPSRQDISALAFISMTSNLCPNLTHSHFAVCLLYTSPSPRDGLLSRMPSSA